LIVHIRNLGRRASLCSPLAPAFIFRAFGALFRLFVQSTALLDPLSKTDMDRDQEYPLIIFGMSAQIRLLIVSYTERHGVIGLISARMPASLEREIYEKC
jgi:uncharacterized DUF497 family protein